MNLVSQNHQYWKWYWKIIVVLFKRRFWTTATLVLLSAASIVTSFLAFMLPLKVIILAGSEGVPRYFRFFMDPDQKWEWIIILTVSSIVCYLLTLLFDAITRKLSVSSGRLLLEGANELAVVSNQEDVVGGFYGKFCSVLAALTFSLVAMASLAVINLLVFSYIALVVILQFLLTAWFLRGNDVNPGAIKSYIHEKYKQYVGYLSNYIFLSGFLVILVPYLKGLDGNILLSLISFLLMRRMLTVMGRAVTTSVELEKARFNINALLFRDYQIVTKEQPNILSMRDIFSKPRRTMLVQRVFQELGKIDLDKQNDRPNTSFEVYWQDSTIRHSATLLVECNYKGSAAPNLEKKHYQIQIFPRAKAIQLDNESLLFSYIPREQLWAPNVLAQFIEGRFHCQLIEYGDVLGRSSEWKEWEFRCLQRTWETEVPESLKTAYGASHRFLHQRLEEQYVKRAHIAVDTHEEKRIFDHMLSNLPKLRSILESLPLIVNNPALNANNVVFSKENSVMITTWGRWTLEPIGYVLPRYSSDEAIANSLDRLRTARKDIPASLCLEHLQLSNASSKLEKAINRWQYKTAISTMETILGIIKSLSSCNVNTENTRAIN